MYKTKNSHLNNKNKEVKKPDQITEKEIQDLITQIKSGIVCTKQVFNVRY